MAKVKRPAKKTLKKKKQTTKPAKKALTHKKAKGGVRAKLDLSNMFSPLDDRVLINPSKMGAKSESGLYIPNSNDQQANKGTVVSVGRGHKSPRGHLRPTAVKIGEDVLYGKYAGTGIKIGDAEYVILRETDIIGVLEK